MHWPSAMSVEARATCPVGVLQQLGAHGVEVKAGCYAAYAAAQVRFRVETSSEYSYTPNMAQISGYGGEYETICRRMVVAGVHWLDAHPEAGVEIDKDPKILDGIPKSQKGQELQRDLHGAMCAGIPDFLGSMLLGALWHLYRIKQVGWEQYRQDMIKLCKKRESTKARSRL